MRIRLMRSYGLFWALVGGWYFCAFLGVRLHKEGIGMIGLAFFIASILWAKHVWRIRRVYKDELIRAYARHDARRRVYR